MQVKVKGAQGSQLKIHVWWHATDDWSRNAQPEKLEEEKVAAAGAEERKSRRPGLFDNAQQRTTGPSGLHDKKGW